MMKDPSIRFKMTIWLFVILCAVVGLTFFLMRYVSSTVLKRTIRDYLVGAVEANFDDIVFVDAEERLKHVKADSANRFIAYNDGYLEIDINFLDNIHDVYTALYTGDGRMLYGENPLAREMEGEPFTNARMWELTVDDKLYSVYDRTFADKELEGLWLRGVVSYEQSTQQMNEITQLCLVVFPVMIILAMIGGYFIIGKMLNPLAEIEQAAAEISYSTDLKKRLNLKGPRDEVHVLADAFDHMVERLDMAFETEHRFTSDVSHELRTPMSVILSQIEYTLDRERTIPEYEDALRVIRRQGVRMNGLINDMLDYTRMEQQSERYPLSVIDLSALTKGVCDELALLKVNDITLTAETEEGIHVNGNAMLLTRLLQNLISNAYRYGRPGGEIRVTLKREEGQVQLSVRDNGIGMNEADKAHIFERFYRAETARSKQGSGLGLSMVKRIVDLHDAKIAVESVEGAGSVFKVTLDEAKEKEAV